MKKTLFLIIGLFLCSNVFAVVPNEFIDGTVAGANDVNENFDYFEIKFSVTGGHDHDGSDSKYISQTQDLTIAGDVAISKNLTIGGSATFSSDLTASGTVYIKDTLLTSSGTELNLLDGVTATTAELNYVDDKINLTSAAEVTGLLPMANAGTGANLTNDPGGIPYCGASALAILADGTSGDLLRSGGTGAPTWVGSINASSYYEPDSSCILAFDHGSLAVDLSTIHNALTLTSLADADLVTGKVSPQCYSFDGSDDFALAAHNTLQAGMAALTFECWFYKDGTGGEYIFANKTDDYIWLQIDDTNVSAGIQTGDGDEALAYAHGLDDNATGAWVYCVVTWDSSSPAKLYINGTFLGNGNDAGNGTVSDSANGIHIGADSAGTANEFGGEIDGLRILRRKMGATEITDRFDMFN
jgi:hypothetical protein